MEADAETIAATGVIEETSLGAIGTRQTEHAVVRLTKATQTNEQMGRTRTPAPRSPPE